MPVVECHLQIDLAVLNFLTDSEGCENCNVMNNNLSPDLKDLCLSADKKAKMSKGLSSLTLIDVIEDRSVSP